MPGTLLMVVACVRLLVVDVADPVELVFVLLVPPLAVPLAVVLLVPVLLPVDVPVGDVVLEGAVLEDGVLEDVLLEDVDEVPVEIEGFTATLRKSQAIRSRMTRATCDSEIPRCRFSATCACHEEK